MGTALEHALEISSSTQQLIDALDDVTRAMHALHGAGCLRTHDRRKARRWTRMLAGLRIAVVPSVGRRRVYAVRHP